MTQYTINIGAVANDGTGDPLRVAFNETNLNFDQIFAAGPVDSNIQIANNTIITTNTNGNLILATNGVGVVTTAAHFYPDISNVRMLGSASKRFNTIYSQYLNVLSTNVSGNLTVTGNLFVTGNTITVNQSNLNVANTLITLAANANTSAQADGGGIFLAGANANITYSDLTDSWNMNIPLAVTGEVTATAFIGDGSQLTNINPVINANDLIGDTLSANVLDSSLITVGVLNSLSVLGNITSSGNINGVLWGDGSNISNITGAVVTGNVPSALFAAQANVAGTANLAYVAQQATNADDALRAIVAQRANVASFSLQSANANVANLAIYSYTANAANVAGTAFELAPTANVSLTGNIAIGGNITAGGNIFTPNSILAGAYYFANGQPFVSGNSTPAGNTGEVQFNNAGAFDGDPGLTYSPTLNTLTVGNTIATTNANVTGNLVANNFYIGNTLFTRTLTVGRDTTPVTVPLATNNSFNVLTAGGNVVVYTT